MKRVFAPGCALMLYKPALAERLLGFLNRAHGGMGMLHTCCRHQPGFTEETEVINVCPGCDKRYRTLYAEVTTISLWELLADDATFPFPDYRGRRMSILDACPTRDQERVHQAVRALLKRMNIALVEPERTGTRSVCCGDSLYGAVPVEEMKDWMRRRAAEMPAEEVAVYCLSCVHALRSGGKKPRHLLDLLFNQETAPKVCEPEEWHAELDRYIEAH